jgi:hypothetical protein
MSELFLFGNRESGIGNLNNACSLKPVARSYFPKAQIKNSGIALPHVGTSCLPSS